MGSILTSSIWVTLRNILSVFIRIAGMILIFKFIGPKEFGLYSTAFGFVNIITVIGQLGLNVYIVQNKSLSNFIINSCLWISIASSILIFPLSYIIVILSRILFDFNSNIWLVAIMLLAAPIRIMGLIPLGLLEKQMMFRETASIDMISQIILYIVTVLCLYLGLKERAMAIGYVSMCFVNSYLLFRKYRIKLSISIDKKSIPEIIKFGLIYNTANIANQLRGIIPIIISPLVSLTNIGLITFSTKINDNVNVFRDTIGKVATSAFCTISDSDLKNKLYKSTFYTIFIICVVNFVIINFMPLIAPYVIGTKWNGSFCLLPYLATSAIFSSLTLLYVSLLLAKGKNSNATILAVIQNILIVSCVYVCVKFFGMIGYGYGFLTTVIGSIISYLLVQKIVGKFFSLSIFLFLLICCILLFIKSLFFSSMCLISLLFFPPIRELIENILKNIKLRFSTLHV